MRYKSNQMIRFDDVRRIDKEQDTTINRSVVVRNVLQDKEYLLKSQEDNEESIEAKIKEKAY